MPLKPLAGLAALLVASASVFAAEPVDVSSLVNNRTIGVWQIDLEQLKLRPAFDWALDTAKRAGVPQEALAPMEQGAAGVALIGQPSVDGLKRAGVSTLGMVVQLDEKAPFDAPPVVLLAVPKPADPKKVTTALGSLGMRSGEKGELMVFSPNLPPGVLGTMQASDRPDLAVTMKGSAVACAFALSPAAKAELMAKPKREDAKAVLAGVVGDIKRYTINIDSAGGPRLNVVAETESPEAAEKLKQTITEERPGRDGKSWAAIARTLPLSVVGSNVVLDARQADIDAFAKSLGPVLSQARRSAQQVQSGSNMRQLLVASMMYANDNKGATPATLDELAQYLAKTSKTPADRFTTNPAKPELGTGGYVYVRAAEKTTKIKDARSRVALYEAGDFGNGINVGFWDGHVEFVDDEAKFKAMLDQSAVAPAVAP